MKTSADMQKMDIPAYFIVHIPKCAGSTVRGFLRDELSPDQIAEFGHKDGNIRSIFKPGPKRADFPEDFRRIVALSGHQLPRYLIDRFQDREVRECVNLRDPVGFFVSHYNFTMQKGVEAGREILPFGLWYRSVQKNPVAQHFLFRYLGIGYPKLEFMPSRERLETIERYLRDFHYVGSYRHSDEFLGRMAAELGIEQEPTPRNVTSLRIYDKKSLPEKWKNRILKENALDQALYERWKDRKWDKSRNPAEAVEFRPDRLSYLKTDLRRIAFRAISSTAKSLARP
ncbi:hypothetical protein GR183_06650 [Stappia sp. GBMRC 2046]|uniref:Sulfotransferase family protein n=1 Tax=Stappia sediminis TaxID=2692190 RepID=A0A7X3LT13_9HYPH|nr:hypothetical protein [Stappia sediminis]MXN64579.1 hypothetical protein [Stappia sediminis]